MPHIRALFFGLAAALPFTAIAETSHTDDLIARFSSVALPIAKGAVLEDNKGCFWWVRDGEKAPEVVALIDDQKGSQLCAAHQPTLVGQSAVSGGGGDRE